MANKFLEALFKGRPRIDNPVGFAGGTLNDQIANQQPEDTPNGAVLQQPDQPLTRPRTVTQPQPQVDNRTAFEKRADEWGKQNPDVALAENWGGQNGGHPSLVRITDTPNGVQIGPYNPSTASNMRSFPNTATRNPLANVQPTQPPPRFQGYNDQPMGTEVPHPAGSIAAPDASRARAVSFDPQTGRPNDQFYSANPDALQGALGKYDAYQQWEPHGGKRGLKNTLKSALMYGAQAVREHPDHPIEALLAGLGTGAVGGTAVPNFKNRLTREWKLAGATRDLQNQLGIEKEKAQVNQLNLNPYYRSIALDQGQQRINNSRTLNEAHIQRWKTMGEEKGREQAMREYQTGMYDDNPEMLDYIGKTYTVNQQALPPVRVALTVGDRTLQVKPDVAARVGATTSEGTANRAARAANIATQQAGANQRAGMNRGRGGGGVGLKNADWSKATKLVSDFNALRDRVNNYDTLKPAERRKESRDTLISKKAALWNEIFNNPTYQGLFETEGNDPNGAVRMKAGAGQGTQQSAPPAQAMGHSRSLFRTRNPEATKGKSDDEVDDMIRSGGFTPLP